MRSRADALAFALAEWERPTSTTHYLIWLSDFFLTNGGNPEAMIARAPDSLRTIFRRAYAIPELALERLPSAEELYHLAAQGYRTIPVPTKKKSAPKKSALWMQILEPAQSPEPKP